MIISQIFCLCLVGFIVDLSNACSIAGDSHPQELFCDAKFAVMAKVKKDVSVGNNPMNRKYLVKIKKIFKDIPGNLKKGHAFLYTPYDSSMCGMILQTKKKYFISGSYSNGRYNFNLFNWVAKWKHMTKFQKRHGLKKKLYAKNCDCTIGRCEDGACDQSALGADCLWGPGYRDDCWGRNAGCFSQRGGDCEWVVKPRKACPPMQLIGPPIQMTTTVGPPISTKRPRPKFPFMNKLRMLN